MDNCESIASQELAWPLHICAAVTTLGLHWELRGLLWWQWHTQKSPFGLTSVSEGVMTPLSLFKRRWLALLERCVLVHCWWQCAITSITNKEEHELLLRQSHCIRMSRRIFGHCATHRRNPGVPRTTRQTNHKKKSVAVTGTHQSDLQSAS